ATVTAAGTVAPPGFDPAAPATAYPYPYPYPTTTGTVQVYPYPPQYGPPVPYPVAPGDEVDEEGHNLRKLRKGNILLGVGGGLLGLGAIAAGVSVALVSNESTQVGGYFVITLAALLGLGGIGCLIAGGIIRGRA